VIHAEFPRSQPPQRRDDHRSLGASASRTFHAVNLREPADVDETVRGWLAESYHAAAR
jgi:hypothetical protein